MSSHHSRKYFELHHRQVDNARSRAAERKDAKIGRYMAVRAEGILYRDCMLGFIFILFAYFNLAIAAYIGYIF